jgi:hypothetical protein
MIEDRLRDTLARVATGGPDEAGAFDRFQRRRTRRSRRAAGSTGLVLVMLLGLAVALPSWRGPARPPVPGTTGAVLVSAGEPVDRRWFPGPLVAVAPNQGFEADVPAGWEVRPIWKGFELRPASPELRRRLAGPVELTTTYLEAFYQPGGRERYQDGSQLPAAAMPRTPAGPELARGQFPGGRSWFRTDGRDGRWHTTNWFVSWPYHCAGGRDCPDVLSLRALRVSYRVDDGSVAEAAALAQRLLGSARPRGNAVPGAAHASRPECVDGRSMTAERWLPTGGAIRYGYRPEAIVVEWTFRTTGSLVPCTVRGPVGVDLLDRSGRRLQVEGNGRHVWLVGDLPESRASMEPAGTLKVTMVWRNWCGDGTVGLRFVGEPVERRAMRILAPACTDPSKPSVLTVRRDPR